MGDLEAGEASAGLEPAGGVELAWSELSVVSSKHKKRLLDSVSGQVGPGFHAIMGPSGAGKSTLLNALACRMDKGATTEGKARLNRAPYGLNHLKRIASYVMQDDLLNSHHTVEETLVFAAKLRLPPGTSVEERVTRIEEVIEACRLTDCRHTLVGSPRKGISGGERKRLCVAVELLTRPALLFLDEPTSGLDSTTALSLCSLLRELADTRRCTILCTIHQPSAKIFTLFHNLLLLQEGRIVFQGPPSTAVTVFAKAGYPCPPLTNPADHVMDVITPRIVANSRAPSYSNLRLQEPPVIELPEQDGELGVDLRQRMPWRRQYTILLGRCWKEQQRRWRTMLVQMLQSLVMATLIGGVFFQIGTNQTSTAKRLPVLFFCTINQGIFGALAVVNSFPAERVLSLRERASGMYLASAYFLAKTTAEAAMYVIAPICFSSIAYWMVGLQPTFGKFCVFSCFMVLCQQAAVSLAQAVSALCRDVDTSVVVLPMALEITRLFGGFFLAPALQQKWMVVLDYLSYVRYTYMGVALNELHGLVLTCTPEQLAKAPGGVCPITSGEQTINTLDLDQLSIGANAGVLLCTAFVGFYS
ncbi:ABC transporter G family [Micractinium conductrix]|uniref:ABC transporter G family n=1 Tax=Micractinium conductrix TaxID=554055 RepID=A0A2P6UZM1_9CHLO|nr:ABC transporter G family [Micractinium conductrix]|eukprot:PSC67254.1 ABC transporter G family [Micractinium conductrix]